VSGQFTPPVEWLEALARVFAQLQGEGFGLADGASFVAFEGLEEFAAVRIEMLLDLAGTEADR